MNWIFLVPGSRNPGCGQANMGSFWICPRICFECRFEHYPTLHLWSSRLVLSQTFQRSCLKTFLYAKCPRPGGRYWVRNSGRFLLGLRDRMTFLFWSHMLKLTLRPLDIQASKSSSWWGSQLINATLAAYPIMWAWLTWCELLIETSAWLLHCQALGCMALRGAGLLISVCRTCHTSGGTYR